MSDSPIKSVQIDWNAATASCPLLVNRKERMRYGDQDKLCEEIVAAITLGLARAADEVMLSALSSVSLETLNLALTAAKGLRFDELRLVRYVRHRDVRGRRWRRALPLALRPS